MVRNTSTIIVDVIEIVVRIAPGRWKHRNKVNIASTNDTKLNTQSPRVSHWDGRREQKIINPAPRAA